MSNRKKKEAGRKGQRTSKGRDEEDLDHRGREASTHEVLEVNLAHLLLHPDVLSRRRRRKERKRLPHHPQDPSSLPLCRSFPRRLPHHLLTRPRPSPRNNRNGRRRRCRSRRGKSRVLARPGRTIFLVVSISISVVLMSFVAAAGPIRARGRRVGVVGSSRRKRIGKMRKDG